VSRESSLEAQVSVLSGKRAAEADATSAGGRTLQAARPIVLARAAVPVAKTVGTAAREGARSAAAWSAPRVNGARAWTAPRIERSGLVIRDTMAPKISEMLTATARRVDVTAPRADVPAPRRRWPMVVAGTALLAAVGAAAVVVLRRRNDDGPCESSAEAADAGTGPPITKGGQSRPAPTAAAQK
jgi:hypothetical protein